MVLKHPVTGTVVADRDVVIPTGDGYFFTPSISALRDVPAGWRWIGAWRIPRCGCPTTSPRGATSLRERAASPSEQVHSQRPWYAVSSGPGGSAPVESGGGPPRKCHQGSWVNGLTRGAGYV